MSKGGKKSPLQAHERPRKSDYGKSFSCRRRLSPHTADSRSTRRTLDKMARSRFGEGRGGAMDESMAVDGRGNKARGLARTGSRQMGEAKAMRVVSVEVQGCEAMAEVRGEEM